MDTSFALPKTSLGQNPAVGAKSWNQCFLFFFFLGEHLHPGQISVNHILCVPVWQDYCRQGREGQGGY